MTYTYKSFEKLPPEDSPDFMDHPCTSQRGSFPGSSHQPTSPSLVIVSRLTPSNCQTATAIPSNSSIYLKRSRSDRLNRQSRSEPTHHYNLRSSRRRTIDVVDQNFATAVQGNTFYPDEVVADWLRDDLLGKTESGDLPPSRKRRRTLTPASPTGHGSGTILYDRHTPPESSSRVDTPVISPVARSLRQRRVSNSIIPPTSTTVRETSSSVNNSDSLSTDNGESSRNRRHRRPVRQTQQQSVSSVASAGLPPQQATSYSNHLNTEPFFFAPSGVSAGSLYPDALGFPLVSGACPYAHSAAYSYTPLPAHHPSIPGGVWPQSTNTPSHFPTGLSPWAFSAPVPTSSYLPRHQHGAGSVYPPQHHPLHGPHNCMLSSLGLNYQTPSSTTCPRIPTSTASMATSDRNNSRPFNITSVDNSVPVSRNLPSRRGDFSSSHSQSHHPSHHHPQQGNNTNSGASIHQAPTFINRRPNLWHQSPSVPAPPSAPPTSRMSTVSSTLAAAQTAAALHFAQTPDVSILLQFLTMIQQPRDQIFMPQSGGGLGAGVRDSSSAGVPFGHAGSTNGHHHSQHHQHNGPSPLNPHHLAAAGTNMETLFHLAAQLENRRRGLSKEELDVLPTWRFKPRDRNEKADKEKEQTRCMVCLEDFESKQTIRVLSCSHEYHSKCVDRWLKNNRTCPMCRADAHDGTHQEEYF